LRHSKKLRGGSFFGLFGPPAPAAATAAPPQTNVPAAQTNGPLTIEQLNAKINEILKRLELLEKK